MPEWRPGFHHRCTRILRRPFFIPPGSWCNLKHPQPFLKIEQGPDKEAAVFAPLQVLPHHLLQAGGVKKAVKPGIRIEQPFFTNSMLSPRNQL
jgi:hypothetical protein